MRKIFLLSDFPTLLIKRGLVTFGTTSFNVRGALSYSGWRIKKTCILCLFDAVRVDYTNRGSSFST